MKRHPVAGTYARAIMEVARDQGGAKADEVFEQLRFFTSEIMTERDFRIFLESPKIPRPDKKRVLETALADQVSPEVLNLLRILVDRDRQGLIEQIFDEYSELYDDFKKRAYVRVDSAVAMTDDRRSRLAEIVGKKLDREIVLTEKVDEDLLGGMQIRFGDTVIDGSIRSQLNKMREAIASQRLGSDLIDED